MKYAISIPITGYVYVELDADNEDEAKEKATCTEFTADDIEEWETHDAIVQGNVFYGGFNKIKIEEIEDE